MGPVELLMRKRQSLVTDDEAVVLILMGKGINRPERLLEASQLPTRTFWRVYSRMQKLGWITVETSRPTGKGVGQGKKSALSLTGEGERIIRALLGAGPSNPSREIPRPVPTRQDRNQSSQLSLL